MDSCTPVRSSLYSFFPLYSGNFLSEGGARYITGFVLRLRPWIYIYSPALYITRTMSSVPPDQSSCTALLSSSYYPGADVGFLVWWVVGIIAREVRGKFSDHTHF